MAPREGEWRREGTEDSKEGAWRREGAVEGGAESRGT